jgi:hypothetical protein
MSKEVRYQVTDYNGHYGYYKDRMEAVMACNKLYKRGLTDPVVMYEVFFTEVDWNKDYEELCNG